MVAPGVTLQVRPKAVIAFLIASMNPGRRVTRTKHEIETSILRHFEDITPGSVRRFVAGLIRDDILLATDRSRSFTTKTLQGYVTLVEEALAAGRRPLPISPLFAGSYLEIPEVLLAALRSRASFSLRLRKNLVSDSPDEIVEVTLTKNGKTRTFSSEYRCFPEADGRAMLITEYKWAMNYLCQRAGLPVPEHKKCLSVRLATAFAETVGFPVAVKPSLGSNGDDGFPNVADRETLERIVRRLLKKYRHKEGVAVEKQIPGNNYRMMILGDSIIGAYESSPPVIVGDGRRTVAGLIENENRRRLREDTDDRSIVIDEELRLALRGESLTLKSIPAKGRKVQLHYNLNRGKGPSVRILDVKSIHPEVERVAVAALRVAGLHYGAIDYVAPSITRPPAETGGKICEVQAHPGMPDRIYGRRRALDRMIAYAFADGFRSPPSSLVVRDDAQRT